MDCWTPSTLEDRLLAKHFDANPGTAYLELPISIASGAERARRIDAVLIPEDKLQVCPQGFYALAQVAAAIKGREVHVIEAKHSLNRGVIGQVMVAKHLVEEAMDPASVAMSVVYARDNPDLRDFCRVQRIQVCHYPSVERESSGTAGGDRPFDLRRAPDEPRRQAFLAGWTRAVNGELFGSIHSRKTHSNMGNLFGWIYGDVPEHFRLETWRRYIKHSMTTETGE